MIPIKDTLFEDFSSHYASVLGLPPLTAKIFTYLMFDFKKEGVTFNQLTHDLCACKSSISNSLGQLVYINLAQYFTKIDDRKRYYRINPEYLIARFQQQIDLHQREYRMLERLYEYKVQVLTEKELEGSDNSIILIKDFIKKTLDNLEFTLNHFKLKHQK